MVDRRAGNLFSFFHVRRLLDDKQHFVLPHSLTVFPFFLIEQAIIGDHQSFTAEEALEFIRKMRVRRLLEFETGFSIESDLFKCRQGSWKVCRNGAGVVPEPLSHSGLETSLFKKYNGLVRVTLQLQMVIFKSPACKDVIVQDGTK